MNAVVSGTVLLAEVYRPTAEAPPFAQDVQTLMNWLFWGVTIACLVGVLITAGMMAFAHRQGSGEAHLTRLGWVLSACVLAAGASGLVAMFL